MRNTTLVLLAVVAAVSVSAQQQNSARAGAAETSINAGSDLPIEQLGKDDLIGITVYDAPELTRTVRVDSDGDIHLPMLRQHVRAAGYYPVDLEGAIAKALTEEQILVDPVVTVSVVEYRSRPISVVGAVRNPLTFQATGRVTLLDALSQAGGLAENAGSEVIVSIPQMTGDGKLTAQVRHIQARALLDSVDPSLNLQMQGGEVIRVPQAGRVYVMGDVKHPGAFPITEGSESSVLKVLALSEGLDRFPAHVAYIYRTEGGNGSRSEIPIELKKIIGRKSPDVPLMANDILYVPEASGRKATLTTLDRMAMVSAGLGSALLYMYK
jgi:polysaccharide export outer membrane protein